jgi:sn-1 stearoyl-lipid 9-desaturase
MSLFLTVFLISYAVHTLGIMIGYHRLLSHRSFSCLKPVEYFWVMAGYLAFEGSPIWWATIHRAHHHYTDTALDPHSPKYGLARAYTGWIMQRGYNEHINPALQAKDLVADPLYSWLEQNGTWHRAHFVAFATCIAFRLLILAFFGWVPALASLLGGFLAFQIPLLVNIACHIPRLGYRSYAPADDSVNVWWIGLLAMGEGWHNNHHASPGSANTGMRWYELDVSYWFIKTMKSFGLVQRINRSTHSQLVNRAAATQRKRQIDQLRLSEFP